MTAPQQSAAGSAPVAATAVLAAQHQQHQAVLRTATAAQVIALWRQMFRQEDARASARTMAPVMAHLVSTRRTISSGLALDYYQKARKAADVAGEFTPKPADPVPAELLQQTQDSTGVGAFLHQIKQGDTPEEASQSAETQLSGSMSRLVSQGGRETIDKSVTDDSKALGWVRQTDANPCYFCAMIASRGLNFRPYRSAGGAGRNANDRFVGGGEFKFHNHCDCTAVPVFDREDPVLDQADELDAQWGDVTSGKGGKAAVAAWRAHWEQSHPQS